MTNTIIKKQKMGYDLLFFHTLCIELKGGMILKYSVTKAEYKRIFKMVDGASQNISIEERLQYLTFTTHEERTVIIKISEIVGYSSEEDMVDLDPGYIDNFKVLKNNKRIKGKLVLPKAILKLNCPYQGNVIFSSSDVIDDEFFLLDEELNIAGGNGKQFMRLKKLHQYHYFPMDNIQCIELCDNALTSDFGEE